MSYRGRMERIEATIDPHGATAHIFRHSYLTYAAGLGTDLKTLQSIAGHADIQTTTNRYVHRTKALKRLWHKHLKALQKSVLCRKTLFQAYECRIPPFRFQDKKEEHLDFSRCS